MDHVLVDSPAYCWLKCHFFYSFRISKADRLINLQVSDCFMINLKYPRF